MLVTAVGLARRVGAGKHSHVPRRTTKTIVKLVLRVEPFRRESAHDRMNRFASLNYECVLRPVATATAWSWIPNPFSITQSKVGAGRFVAITPATDTDHFV